MKKPLYIFPHMPKCAGMTFYRSLKTFKRDKVLFLYKTSNQEFATINEIKNHIKNLPNDKKNEIEIIVGHKVYYGLHELFPNREIRYIIFMRNPIKKIPSYYNYFLSIKKIPPFNKWLKTDSSWKTYSINYLHAMLRIKPKLTKKNYEKIYNEIIRKLEEFYFIGLVENKEDFLFVFKLLNCPPILPKQNTSKKKIILSKLQKEHIAKNAEFDLKLHQEIIKLNNNFKLNKNFKKIVGKEKIKKYSGYYYLKALHILIKRLIKK